MRVIYILLFWFSLCSPSIVAQESFNTLPPPIITNFTCRGRKMGFYADLQLNCQVYHNCDDRGNKFTYYCPIDTAFRQEAMVCDHAHLVKCQNAGNNKSSNDEEFISDQSRILQSQITLKPDKRLPRLSRSFWISQDNVLSNSVQNRNITFNLSSSLFLGNRNNITEKRQSQNNIPELSEMRTTFVSTRPLIQNFNFPSGILTPITLRPQSGRLIIAKNSSKLFLEKYRISDVLQPPFIKSGGGFQEIALSQSKFEPKIKSYNSSYRSYSEKSPIDDLNRGELSVFTNSQNRPFSFLQPAPSGNQKSNNSDQLTIKSSLGFSGNNDPYRETLRSIQREGKNDRSFGSAATITVKPTNKRFTDDSFLILTASLIPLKPNQLANDPYYPISSTSTEMHYTSKTLKKTRDFLRSPTKRPLTDLKVPPVLPDLNSFEDLIDRKKDFYIPKLKST